MTSTSCFSQMEFRDVARAAMPPLVNVLLKEHRPLISNCCCIRMMTTRRAAAAASSLIGLRSRRVVGGGVVRCSSSSSSSESSRSGGIWDFIGGDLLKPDLGRWMSDVEQHKALAIYPPHEGGYEGRYLTRLRYQGYYFLDLTARGLGDPETTLTKIHPVCPAHLGKQPIARWYYPPEVDYRLAALPPDAKGLVLWIIEAKVIN
uniref:Uncharacterized protein MANES_18G123900 n=1 Tax=Rhizophora mucronata TaxID=61149 RepID=A0A2P2ISI3_RHIMU